MDPIIKSLLTNDAYKPTMSRFAYTMPTTYYDRMVRYRFYNRTKSVPLADHIPASLLSEQLEEIRKLRFTDREIAFIGSIHPALADPAWAAALREVRLPAFNLSVTPDHQFDLTVEGKWGQAIWWEIPLLAVVQELYTKKCIAKDDLKMWMATGLARQQVKIDLFRQHPDIKFLWFGTRRAAFREWERLCLETWLKSLPDQVIACSNLELAMEYGIKAGGTQAHEALMVIAAIMGMVGDNALYGAQNLFYDMWWSLFGGPFSIALSDTFGSNHFFRTFGEERALRWWGARQDSGDPFWWGERYIEMLRSHGVNPIGKMGLFSDGLDPWLVVRLNDHFRGRMDRGWGIGTSLSNDIGVPNLSIVMKVEAVMDEVGRWVSAVKLSDNPAKAIGDPAEVQRYKRVFDYQPGETVECRY